MKSETGRGFKEARVQIEALRGHWPKAFPLGAHEVRPLETASLAFRIAANAGRRTLVTIGKQVWGRDQRSWIMTAAVLGELPNDAKTSPPPLSGVHLWLSHHPTYCQIQGDVIRPPLPGERDKLLEFLPLAAKFVAEGATQCEILVEQGLKRTHRAPAGHGVAIRRRDSMSTLA